MQENPVGYIILTKFIYRIWDINWGGWEIEPRHKKVYKSFDQAMTAVKQMGINDGYYYHAIRISPVYTSLKVGEEV